MASSAVSEVVGELLKRAGGADDTDPDAVPKSGDKEKFSAFALFVLIVLLIVALFTAYTLQARKIQAVHETVLSIFAGMVIGLAIRISSSTFIQGVVSFDQQFFFNLLLPPIILASGYELHQANFFRNIGPILTFAFAGTFISALVLGGLIWLWTRLPLPGSIDVSFLETFSVGATLSATDPVTILAIFNAYKVDPKLYTIIFGESILNDAIAIVLYQTAERYAHADDAGKIVGSLGITSLLKAIGLFLLVFFVSVVIGVAIGVLTTLGLKFTHVRRTPKIESCLIILIAYASYFFSTGIDMSGIVTLLFCGITLKHYAYYNMSRRTQLTTKFIFQVLAQLSENFIFIYLGLTLFTERQLEYNPYIILITIIGVCISRYAAVFPLAKLINVTVRWRARRRGQEVAADELPYSYQVMLFWAGLRGAVGVALAAGFDSFPKNFRVLQSTVLVVVVLTVIIFGGTTARMLEIMGIRTGVVEEVDSDDEFDIETVANGTYYKRGGTAFGHTPTRGDFVVPLDKVSSRTNGSASPWIVEDGASSGFSSGSNRPSPPARPATAGRTDSGGSNKRSNSLKTGQRDPATSALLLGKDRTPSDEDLWSDSDLPPAAPRRSKNKHRPSPPPSSDPRRAPSPYSSGANTLEPPSLGLGGIGGGGGAGAGAGGSGSSSASGSGGNSGNGTLPPPAVADYGGGLTATGAIRDFFTGTEETSVWFKKLDDTLIKPTLLLDQSSKGGSSGRGGRGGGGGGGGGQGDV